MKCRHCGRRKGQSSRRKLCYACHSRMDVRNLYETCPKFTARDEPEYRGPAPEACQHRPGTKEYESVLQWRAENGYDLFHPDDCKLRCA